MSEPRIDSFNTPDQPRALMLLLHGGQEYSEDPVRNRHASWWRMAAMARSLRGFARGSDLSLSLLQYRLRGWNNPERPAPVQDARWALNELAVHHPGTPIILIGHSMGGRTACRVADDPRVAGVVGLAPWLPQAEPHTSMAGQRLHVLHGTRDAWTSPQWSRAYVEHSRRIALVARWESIEGAGHFMFRRPSRWRQFVEQSVTDILDHAASDRGASNKGSA